LPSARLDRAAGPAGARGVTCNFHLVSFGAVWTAHAWGAVRGPAVVVAVSVLSASGAYAARGLIPMAFAVGSVPRDSAALEPLLDAGFPLWRGVRDGAGDDRVFFPSDAGLPQTIWPAAFVPYVVWWPGLIWGGTAGDAGRRVDVSMSVRFYPGVSAAAAAGYGTVSIVGAGVVEGGPRPSDVAVVDRALGTASGRQHVRAGVVPPYLNPRQVELWRQRVGGGLGT